MALSGRANRSRSSLEYAFSIAAATDRRGFEAGTVKTVAAEQSGLQPRRCAARAAHARNGESATTTTRIPAC
jgi:hypothetical protein